MVTFFAVRQPNPQVERQIQNFSKKRRHRFLPEGVRSIEPRGLEGRNSLNFGICPRGCGADPENDARTGLSWWGPVPFRSRDQQMEWSGPRLPTSNSKSTNDSIRTGRRPRWPWESMPGGGMAANAEQGGEGVCRIALQNQGPVLAAVLGLGHQWLAQMFLFSHGNLGPKSG